MCPAGSITGGAENLHQVVDALRKHGADANIAYFPNSDGGGTAEFFKQYDAPIGTPMDDSRNVIIIPELATFYVKRFPQSQKVIFWLSVDNYYYHKGDSLYVDLYKRIRSLQFSRVRISRLKDCLHIAQSAYANHFLARKGIYSYYIGDYLNDDFINRKVELHGERKNQVLFNPKKGLKYIKRLQKLDPGIEFKPLINMSREEVYTAMLESKLYIDLGLHPGKDRIPREAAAMGCCIITCRKGSANNPFDVPIPDGYKFILSNSGLRAIIRKVGQVFADYESESMKFDGYRKIIQNEKASFFKNIENLHRILQPVKDN